MAKYDALRTKRRRREDLTTLLGLINCEARELEELLGDLPDVRIQDLLDVAVIHEDNQGATAAHLNTRCPVPVAICRKPPTQT